MHKLLSDILNFYFDELRSTYFHAFCFFAKFMDYVHVLVTEKIENIVPLIL